MSNRLLAISIALVLCVEVTSPAEAFPFPAITLDIQSTGSSDAVILVKKGKGHGEGRNASSGTIAMNPIVFPVTADIRIACAASTAIRGSEVATRTSPMARTEPRRTFM